MLDNAPLEGLLARVAAGDRAAFRALYDQSASHLLGVALRILGTRSLAEEALQDAFVQIWQHAGEFQPGRAQPSAWLNSIVRYRSLDLLRRSGREVPIEDAPEALLATLDAPAADGDVARCLSALPREARASITLAFVEGYSHGELARRLGKPLGTIKSWIRRGLAQLKECLQP